MLRTMTGFVVAPFIGVALSTLLVLGPRTTYEAWLVYVVVGSLIAYASVLLLGLPAYLVMKRTTKLKWWQIGLAGGLCGLPYWLISEYPFTTTYFQDQGMKDLVLYFVAGAIAGLTFWMVTRGTAPSTSIERER
jgi:hypothetical protein